MKYRKKPVVIEAIQWKGNNIEEILDFVGEDKMVFEPATMELIIFTLEGNHHASIGDFVIKGVKGEYYPCKPDIFEQTYEKVEEN